MKTVLLAAMAVLAFTGVATADTRSIPVQALHAIEVSGPFRIEITTGPTTSAVLEGATSELAKLSAHVNGARLVVRQRCGPVCIDGDDSIHVVLRVTAPVLQAIRVSKGAEATAVGLNTRTLKLDVSTGGTLKADGVCDALSAGARMGGELDAGGLVCRDVDASASMGGAAHVNATQSVGAHASMGGSVKISGSPLRHDATAFMGGIVDGD